MNNEFIDNAVDKARAAFDIACKKTGEFVSSSKQKIDIATMENKLKKLYEELGKLEYGALNGEDNAEAINEKCEEIKTKLSEIDAAKAEDAKIFSKKVCGGCGAYVDEKDAFCPKCGKQFGEDNE